MAVAKHDAPIFVSVIERLALLVNTVVYLWPELEAGADVWRRYVLAGDCFGEHAFAPCHFYLPVEMESEFKDKARILEMAGLEGMFSTHAIEYNEVHETGRSNEILWETHLKTCTNPSLVGVSEHFLLICTQT